MFIGEYNHTLDTKGRVIVPVKYREELGEEFIVTKGLKDCLWIFSNEGWKDFMDKLSTLPKTNNIASKLVRHFSAGATSCELDKQGRILLTANLRKFASLDKEVVLAGVLDRIELWDKGNWDNATDIDITEVTEELSELNISL